MKTNHITSFGFIIAVVLCWEVEFAWSADGLIGHWKLADNARDKSGAGRHAVNHGVRFTKDGAVFNGRDAWLEVPVSKVPQLGPGAFTISMWVHTAKDLDDVLGDLIGWYDPATRTGVNLTLMNFAGVTSAQSNWRNILFGIDAGRLDAKWTDCGRPGNNHMIKALAVFEGSLYAATWEPGDKDRGHVYRYAGGKFWVDCGAPDKCNSVTSMAVHDGKLYVGSELYSGGGSSLPLSPNTKHGGHVYRYEGGKRWTNCGKVADVRSISGLVSFKGKLYAGTGTTGAWRDKPRHRGMYRFDGIDKWTDCGCPDLRVVHLGVHNGALFGLSYDAGGFFKYKGGDNWQRLGPMPDTTQAYSMAIYEGHMHVGTWPTGSVFTYGGPQKWKHAGRLGMEKEVMGMSVYNGKLYAGTLPLADVYRYDNNSKWTSVGQLDKTPNVRYRRAWTMAVYEGKLFCGTLPSGNILSLEAGKCVTYDRELPSGWHHLAAVKTKERLQIYLDGKRVAQSTSFKPGQYNLRTKKPLKIGFGQHDYFNGKMRDVRLYNRALSSVEVVRVKDVKP